MIYTSTNNSNYKCVCVCIYVTCMYFNLLCKILCDTFQVMEFKILLVKYLYETLDEKQDRIPLLQIYFFEYYGFNSY